MREESEDPTYVHANFVKECLAANIDIPRHLVVSLLDRKVDEAEKEKKWSVVYGFPESLDYLDEFEEKVCVTHIKTIHLTSSRYKDQTTLSFSLAHQRGCLIMYED